MRKAFLLLLLSPPFLLLPCACRQDLAVPPLVVTTPTPTCVTVVNFQDANLRSEIRAAVDKPSGNICLSDLTGLTLFDASSSGVGDLTGLENCANLAELHLHHNSITGLGPLSGLTYLTWLTLHNNTLVDIGPLSGLTDLTRLGLGFNDINDLTALSGLTNLTGLDLQANNLTGVGPLSGLTDLDYLNLSFNGVTDLSALSGLTNLTVLHLEHNAITALAALSGLTGLRELYLGDNAISDITALRANCDAGGLGAGDTLDLQNNPLSAQATGTDIPYLQVRGVTVTY